MSYKKINKQSNNMYRKIGSCFLCLVLILTMSGCSASKNEITKDLGQNEEKTEDANKNTSKTSNPENLDSENSNTLSEDAKADSAFMKQYHIPVKWQQSLSDSTGKHGMEMDATIHVPKDCSPAVYEESMKPFDKDAVIARAKALFDEGEITFVKPLSCWTFDELSTTYSSKEIEDATSLLIKDIGIFLEEGFDEANIQTYQEGDFSKGNGKTFYDEIMIVEGKIEHEDYHLLAFTKDGLCRMELVKKSVGYYQEQGKFMDYFSFMYTAGEIVYDPEHPEYGSNPILRKLQSTETQIEITKTENSEKIYGKNQCKHSMEEATQLALKCVDKMGDKDFEIVRSYGLVDCSYTHFKEGIFQLPGTTVPESISQNGYAFYLQRKYGQIACDQGEGYLWWRNITLNEKRAEFDPKKMVVPQELYRVWVSDEGVTKVDIVYPQYEITGDGADTNLMNFQDIQNTVVETLNAYMKKWEGAADASKPVTINEIQLSYVTVNYDGKYNLVPAWVLKTKEDGPIMIVNAIDAEVIYMAPNNLWSMMSGL